MRKYLRKFLAISLVMLTLSGLVAAFNTAPSSSAAPSIAPAAILQRAPQQKIKPAVLEDTANGKTASFILYLADQANISNAYQIKDRTQRGWFVYNTLKSRADRTQAGLKATLAAQGVKFQSFWIANAIVVYEGKRELVSQLAARPEVQYIEPNRESPGVEPQTIANRRPAPPNTLAVPQATPEWGVRNVNAPQVWSMGYTGTGIVIGDADTGQQWNHPALINHYRGWNGTTADHNYNWRDAIHDPRPNNPCGGGNLLVPCDDYGHGTHTAGSIVGVDAAQTRIIGVAPGAKWIGCRNMDNNLGTPARYTECFEFFTVPTDLAGNNPRPDLRADIINNSWECGSSEGCAANTLQTVVENTVAAGVFVEASAQNSGPNCSTVQNPPAIYAAAFSTGAYASNNVLASFSSRGPVNADGSGRLKPEIAAPGVGVVSSWPTDTYQSTSGTSMAGPHVVGVIALLWSAKPSLRDDFTMTKYILTSTANISITINSGPSSCGGTSWTTIPNNFFGWGRVDALAAVNAALVTPTPTPPPPTDTPAPTDTPIPTNTPLPPTATPPPPTPTLCPNPFVDINGNIFYQAIMYLYCRNEINGLDSTHFGPSSTSTRAQFAKVVVLGFNIPSYTPTQPTFTDVPPTYFAYPFIEAGYRAAILSGYDQATCAQIGATYPCYGPNRPITRAQLTKLVVTAGNFPLFTPTMPSFTDVPTSNIFYLYIETAKYWGIINGYPDNTFRPNNNIRRDEMAQIVYKGITRAP